MAFDFPTAPAVDDAYTDPVTGASYVFDGEKWASTGSGTPPTPPITPGDLKHGFQTADHAGWIKLDGRAVSTLTATQQAAAATLGFTANLPLGDGAVFMQSAAALGTVGGGVLTQAMLPDIDLTAASAGSHNHLARGHQGNAPPGPNWEGAGAHNSQIMWDQWTHRGPWITADWLAGTFWDHYLADAAGAHTHVVPLGGSGATIVPKNVSANAFIFLGA